MLTRLIKTLILFLFLGNGLSAQTEIKDTIVVARDGTGKFRNIQDAIESIRAFMDYSVVVYVKNGTYKEKVVIPSWVKNVIIIGEDAERTILTYDDHANIDKMGTFRTYTLKIEGSHVTIKNMTIRNRVAMPPMGT